MNFDGTNKLAIENLNYSNIGFIMPYYISGHKRDNILVSSRENSDLGYSSGVSFGINKFNYPYVEFIDYANGPTTYCLHEPVNNTGIIYFGLLTSNGYSSVELGYYDQVEKDFKRYNFYKNPQTTFNSDSWHLGGSNVDDTNRYFSGIIPEIAFLDPLDIDFENAALSTVSGFTHDIETYVTTGYISGQTGIIYGDIIYITGCYFYYLNSGEYYLDEELSPVRFFASPQQAIDCLGRDYITWTSGVLYDYLTKFRYVQYLQTKCQTSKNFDFYVHDNSGLIINYTAVSTLPFLAHEELENVFADAVYLDRKIQDKDRLSLYALGKVNPSIDYGKQLYNIFNKTYKIEGTINTGNFSGLYYNGQLQTISSNYTVGFADGEVKYFPERDFFVSGKNIYSNGYYQFNENINIDTWPTFDFVFTGSVSSGSEMPGINFGNQMVFFNGQKLHSGTDYQNNIMLFDIPTGYNVISITKNKLNFIENNLVGPTGRLINFGPFSKKTSSVWVNGVRLKNGKDYTEISFINDVRDLYTREGGVLINGN